MLLFAAPTRLLYAQWDTCSRQVLRVRWMACDVLVCYSFLLICFHATLTLSCTFTSAHDHMFLCCNVELLSQTLDSQPSTFERLQTHTTTGRVLCFKSYSATCVHIRAFTNAHETKKRSCDSQHIPIRVFTNAHNLTLKLQVSQWKSTRLCTTAAVSSRRGWVLGHVRHDRELHASTRLHERCRL
jgi:hypothetical protein